MESAYQAYKNKITNKLWKKVSFPAQDKVKGSILLSYMTDPFTRAPWERFSDPHTNYWECKEMARLFSIRGYTVDIINSSNKEYVPRKNYSVCIDTTDSLEYLSRHLPENCKKVMHVTSAYWEFQNNAEQKRLDELQKRRGIVLKRQRLLLPSKNPEIADFLEGFGNNTIRATYSKFGKEIYPIPLSVSSEFDLPQKKDFISAAKNFLWFGGGGAVLKGLDITLEAFRELPELHLHIIGPVAAEADFYSEYVKELSMPNIHVHGRPRASGDSSLVNGSPIQDIFDTCAFIIYPTASDSASGSVVQSMHRGVIPITTKESGISEKAPVHFISDISIEGLKRTIVEFSQTAPKVLEKESREVWLYARKNNTREIFSKTYTAFIDTILKP